jgi:cation transport regulator ChaB
MNLQETIKRILKEESDLFISLRRRINFETLEQLYQFVLNIASERYKDHKKILGRTSSAITPYHFQQKVISNLLWEVCENYELECEDEGDNYKQLWNFLSKMYSKRTIKHFYEIR